MRNVAEMACVCSEISVDTVFAACVTAGVFSRCF